MTENDVITVLVTQETAGRRVDALLAETLGFTRSALQRYLEQGYIVLNSKPVTKNYRVHVGDAIVCTVPPPEPYTVEAEPIPLDIVYEDADVVVVNKPRGMVVHPGPGHLNGTLVNALLYHCGDSLSGINGTLRPGIVHRIDRDTSGLIAVAKNDHAHQHLAAQLATHTMCRTYHAVVRGRVKTDAFTIDQPIGRHPVDRMKMAVLPQGRNAVTHITVLERFNAFTLIEARLETGRTHQIRVHMARAGYPLLGDVVYGSEKQPFGLNGQVLHAKRLCFTHPGDGEPRVFETEWPVYFAEAVARVSTK